MRRSAWEALSAGEIIVPSYSALQHGANEAYASSSSAKSSSRVTVLSEILISLEM